MLPRASELFPLDFKFATPVAHLPQNWSPTIFTRIEQLIEDGQISKLNTKKRPSTESPLRIEAMLAQEMNNRTYLTIVTLFYFLNPPFNTKLQLFLWKYIWQKWAISIPFPRTRT